MIGAPDHTGPLYPKVPALRDELLRRGYVRGQSTIYADVQAGLLRPTGPGGAFTGDDLERYIKSAGLKLPGAAVAQAGSTAQRKQLAEAKDAEERARMRELNRKKLEKSLIDRDQVESDLADRARLLRAGLHNWARREVDTLIALVGGNPEQAPEALAAWEDAIDEILDSYARAGRIDLEPPQ